MCNARAQVPIRDWRLFQSALATTRAFSSFYGRGVAHREARSAADVVSYERLEFLGDAVVAQTVRSFLARRFPRLADGGEKNAAVGALCRGTWAYRIALLLELDKFVVDSLPVRLTTAQLVTFAMAKSHGAAVSTVAH